jgi:hypothetical protein
LLILEKGSHLLIGQLGLRDPTCLFPARNLFRQPLSELTGLLDGAYIELPATLCEALTVDLSAYVELSTLLPQSALRQPQLVLKSLEVHGLLKSGSFLCLVP